MKKRLLYEKPSMEVFELKQQPQILAGSTGVQDYQWNTYNVSGHDSDGKIYVAIKPTSSAKIWIYATNVILSDGTFAKAGTDGAIALVRS